MSKSLYPDLVEHLVRPDLGPDCLKMSSVGHKTPLERKVLIMTELQIRGSKGISAFIFWKSALKLN